MKLTDRMLRASMSPACLRRRWRQIEGPTWLVAAAIYGGWLAVTWAYTVLPAAPAMATAAVLVAWQSSLQHELVHGHPTGSPTVNRLLVGPPLGLWMPYAIYRELHLRHHREAHLTCPIEDPESFYLSPARWRRLGPTRRAVRRAYNTLAGRLALGPALHAGRLWTDAARHAAWVGYGQAGVWLRHLAGVALVFTWTAGICGIPAWLYLLGVAYPAASLMLVRSYAEHRAAADPAARTAVVEAGAFWRLLFLGNNYHALHHARPDLPWYALAPRYRAERERILAANGGYLVAGYGALFRHHLLRAKEPPIHPLAPEAG